MNVTVWFEVTNELFEGLKKDLHTMEDDEDCPGLYAAHNLVDEIIHAYENVTKEKK